MDIIWYRQYYSSSDFRWTGISGLGQKTIPTTAKSKPNNNIPSTQQNDLNLKKNNSNTRHVVAGATARKSQSAVKVLSREDSDFSSDEDAEHLKVQL